MNANWLKYLPGFIRAKLEGRHGFQVIIGNIGWLFADKILRMGMGLLVIGWVARYLGPAQFGLMNYAIAFVALFGSIATLGLNGIVVRDLVNAPESANATLGTAFMMQIFGGLLAFLLALTAINLARPDDALAKLMVAVLGFAMVFKATDAVKYWFESQIKSKYTVWVENAAFMLFAAVKVGLILTHANLMAFVWTAFAEGALVAVGLLAAYAWRGGRLGHWRVQYTRAKTLLKDSWPLILSSMAIMVYMRIDQIMLGYMLGDVAVGIYSAAVRISEVWYFIPIAIMASVFPSIIEARKISQIIYYQRLQKLYDLLVLVSLAVAIAATFMSSWIVDIMFGQSFIDAGPVLAIHIWAGIFVSLGLASGNWLILEGYQKDIFYRAALGAVINIVLNWILIPMYGVMGAAFSTVIAYFFAVFSVYVRRATRPSAAMMLQAIFIKKSIGRFFK